MRGKGKLGEKGEGVKRKMRRGEREKGEGEREKGEEEREVRVKGGWGKRKREGDREREKYYLGEGLREFEFFLMSPCIRSMFLCIWSLLPCPVNGLIM